MKKTKEKGITLIALIITIIVMLILVGVTVNVVLNGGLFKTAEDAKNGTQVEADRETLQAAVVGALDKKELKILTAHALIDNLPSNWDVSGNNGGPYKVTSPNNNVFSVDGYGTIQGPIIAKDLTELEKYILGENGEGGVELFGEEGTDGILNTRFSFINVPEELQSNGGVACKTMAYVSTSIEKIFKDGKEIELNMSIVDIYFTYNGGTYKFRALAYGNDYGGLAFGKTLSDIGVKALSYDETSKVGNTVSYDNKKWVILYDDSEHGLQMISEDPLTNENGSKITLGYNDSILNGVTIEPFPENKTKENESPYLDLERAVYSYNNAVKTLNDACRDLVTPNSKITSVRSVGSRATGDAYEYEENVEMYTQKAGDANTVLIDFPETDSYYEAGVGNGKGKTTDLNYEEDFDRMVTLGINQANSDYWLASRVVGLYPGKVYFDVRFVSGSASGRVLWSINSSNASATTTFSYAVRPVISLSSDALVPADAGAGCDYKIAQ